MSRTPSKNLQTVQELLDYLNLRENQFTSDLHVVKWNGKWPSISTYRLEELNNPKNLGFAYIILKQHQILGEISEPAIHPMIGE